MPLFVPLRTDLKQFELVDNYIYMYHLDKFLILPTYPENIQDQVSASFNPTTPLARSAPIFSYSHSGPRTMSIQLPLHRELMKQINYEKSNVQLEGGDDYVDVLIREIQAIAIPEYHATNKMVDPPMVAVRFGTDIYCKGVVNGSVSVGYQLPILKDGRYAQVSISFSVTEVDPYSASEVAQYGSLRGLDTALEKRFISASQNAFTSKSDISPITAKKFEMARKNPNLVPHRGMDTENEWTFKQINGW